MQIDFHKNVYDHITTVNNKIKYRFLTRPSVKKN